MKNRFALIFGLILFIGVLLQSCTDSKLQSENVDDTITNQSIKILIDTVGFGVAADTVVVPGSDTLKQSYMDVVPSYPMYERKQVFVYHPYKINQNALRTREHIKQNSIRNNC